MSLGIILACLWGLTANVIAMLPSKDHHWTNAYVLIAVGLPILGLIAWQHGPWLALLILCAGASILRWPVIYLGRWMRRQVGR